MAPGVVPRLVAGWWIAARGQQQIEQALIGIGKPGVPPMWGTMGNL